MFTYAPMLNVPIKIVRKVNFKLKGAVKVYPVNLTFTHSLHKVA